MRRAFISIEKIKQQINSYKGQDINLTVNHGRNKISSYEGKIDNIYPSLFTVNIKDGENYKTKCYSYSDVLCGQVKLCPWGTT